MALTAQAVVQETWSENQTAERALTDDLEVTVEEGVTVTCSGAISGDYKLIKRGEGELILAAENTFGSAQVVEGILRANCNGALGSGKITIDGSTTKQCRLDFGVMPAAATFANEFVVENASSSTYPAVRFWTGSGGKTVTFKGSWTAKGDLCFSELCNYAAQSKNHYTFNCPVNAGANQITFAPASIIYWKGVITAGTLYSPGSAGTTPKDGAFTSYCRGSNRFYAKNNIGELKPKYVGSFIYCEDAIDGIINLYQVYIGGSASRGNLWMTKNNTCAALVSPTQSDDSGNFKVNSDDGYLNIVVTLTVTGTPTTATQSCYFKLMGAVSLVLDAYDGFIQKIIGRKHTTTGSLTVKKGELSLEGSTTFANAQWVKVSGGKLNCKSTAASCFAAITNLTVGASGILQLAATATTSVPDDSSMDLEIAKGAQIDLPEATTWHVRRFVVDGKCKGIDTWTHDNCSELPENLTVISSMTDAEPVEEIAWKGGSDNFTDAANWGKSGDALDFSGNKYVATFADANAASDEATIDGEVNLHGLVFAGSNFGLRASGDAASLSLFEAQLAFADDAESNSESHFYTNDVPTQFFADAAINVPANDTLVLGDVSTTYGLDFLGRGCTYLDGEVLVDGAMNFLNGRVYLRGTIAACDYVEQAYSADCYVNLNYASSSMSSLKYSLVLDGGTIEKPVHAKAFGGSDVILATTANTTNLISGKLVADSPIASIAPANGSTLTLSGGADFNWSIRKEGSGTLVVTNKKMVVSNGDAGFYVRNGTLRLEVANNSAGSTLTVSGGRLETTVNDAFTATKFECSGGTADFGTTTQSVYRILGGANGTLTGDYGSCLRVTVGPANPVGGTNICCQVSGGLSLAMAGTGTLLLTNRTFSSSGDLMATNGVLELAADASWLNGTNFTAKGTGTLKFGAAGQVNSDFAVLHMDDDGKVEIPDNVTVSVYRAETNGVWLKAGNYTCIDGEAVGATGIPQLTGTGVLSVRCQDAIATTYKMVDSGGSPVTNVVVSNSWVVANVPANETITNVPTGGNGYPYWKSYVLGLTPTNPVSKPIIKGVQNADPNNLAFRLGNVTYNAASGVKATYKVRASDTIGGTYSDVSDPVDADKDATVALPTDSPVKYYKVYINYSN